MMNLIVRLVAFISLYVKRIGTCAKVGVIIGAGAGLALTLLDIAQGGLMLTAQEAFWIALILAGVMWLVILFLLCVFVRMTLRSIFFPTLINSLLTCIATVFVVRYLHAYHIAWLIGIMVGLLVGALLCRLNALFQKLLNR